jgi:hypothetical protein
MGLEATPATTTAEDRTHFATGANLAPPSEKPRSFEGIIKEEERDEQDQPEESIDFVFNARNHRKKVRGTAERAQKAIH